MTLVLYIEASSSQWSPPATTSYELRVTSYELRATSYELRATSYELRATSYELPLPRQAGKSFGGRFVQWRAALNRETSFSWWTGVRARFTQARTQAHSLRLPSLTPYRSTPTDRCRRTPARIMAPPRGNKQRGRKHQRMGTLIGELGCSRLCTPLRDRGASPLEPS